MDYKKKYKDALERARIWKDKSGMPKDKQGILDDIFPELAESEDEKIRKELIEFVKSRLAGFPDCKRFTDWLEKQERKPDDKIEPKFHEGEWIVFNGLTLYVNEVVQGYYRTISIGGIPNSYDWDIDNAARLWTIKDAKDGDVLACGNDIVIFKENNYNPEDQSGCMFVYCAFNKCGYWYEIGGINPTCYKPATKEQRDTLMKAMVDARYEWDAENRQLKKIPQRQSTASAREGKNIRET